MHASSKGYVLLLGMIFFGVFLSMSAGLTSYITLNARAERSAVASKQALALAEAGIDKAAYELNHNSNYSGESNTALGAGRVTVAVTTIDGSTKRISATAYVPNATNPIAVKTARANISISAENISFNYGVQAGAGGFRLSGGSTINGNVYSNGDINATTGVRITGSATAANPPAVTADQSNNSPTPIGTCTGSTCQSFGNAAASQDFAQSFQISSATAFDSVRFYIKKIGSPSNATVRIVADNAGSPSNTTLLSATLPASSVTASFGWVSVSLPSTPVLSDGTPYWLVIDAGTNGNNYYSIGTNTSYGSGVAKVGQYNGSWNSTSPSRDGNFQIYLGGGTSMIGGNSYTTGVYVGTSGTDLAWANTVQGATVSGPLYCKTGSYTNKSCDTSRPDPSPAAMPMSDSNIDEWKAEAAAGTVHNGNYAVGWQGATIGPMKINGNLTVGGGGILTITGTLWVTGNVTVSGGGQVRLASSYGTNDGAIITDGIVTVGGGANFAGSGQSGSYPFLISTSACPNAAGCSGNEAIDLSGGAGTVALVAQDGTVRINGGSSLKAVTGRQIVMEGGATLYYDSGLISTNFSSGPGGSWEFVPGTYVID